MGRTVAHAGLESSSRNSLYRLCDVEAAELWAGVVLLEDGSPAAEGFISIK